MYNGKAEKSAWVLWAHVDIFILYMSADLLKLMFSSLMVFYVWLWWMTYIIGFIQYPPLYGSCVVGVETTKGSYEAERRSPMMRLQSLFFLGSFRSTWLHHK